MMQSSTQSAHNKPRNQIAFIATLAMMSMIGIFSSDVYLPSMPSIANYFVVDYGAVQRTISVYLLGLAIFQVIYGPLSDHFGRKPVLIVGTVIYIVASIACVLSTSMHWLMIFRFIQAIGACAGILMGKCIVTDVFDAKAAAKIFTIILPIVAMSPAIAPVIGGYVQQYSNWRFVFAIPVVFGIILLWLIVKYIHETNHTQSKITQINQLLSGYQMLLRHKSFLCYATIVALVYCSWFAYLSNSSYIYQQFGLIPKQVGYCYISQSIASVLGSFTARQLINKATNPQLIIAALIINLISTVFIGIIGVHSLFFFVLMITICAFTNGVLLPLNIGGAMSTAVRNNAQVGGAASGMLGFLQIGGGALGIFMTSGFDHGAYTLSIILSVCMLISIIVFYILKRGNHGTV